MFVGNKDYLWITNALTHQFWPLPHIIRLLKNKMRQSNFDNAFLCFLKFDCSCLCELSLFVWRFFKNFLSLCSTGKQIHADLKRLRHWWKDCSLNRLLGVVLEMVHAPLTACQGTERVTFPRMSLYKSNSLFASQTLLPNSLMLFEGSLEVLFDLFSTLNISALTQDHSQVTTVL